jgi:pimeloyl-ACP methyl ester carboxylesterase
MGNKFIFPVPKPSYNLKILEDTLLMIPSTGKQKACCGKGHEMQYNIICRYLPRVSSDSPYLIIFFHGNSEDIGSKLTRFLSIIGQRFTMNILCPEYPKYGAYKLRDHSNCLDQAILKDAREVIEYANKTLKYPLENIILIGRSLGSGVAVQMATEYKLKGIILISPYTSIRDVAKNMAGRVLCKLVGNMFRSVDLIDKITCPALFIHGQKDTLIPPRMSEELFEKCISPKEIKINPEMTHNQFRIEAEIFMHMEEFMINKMKLGSFLWGIDTFPAESLHTNTKVITYNTNNHEEEMLSQ